MITVEITLPDQLAAEAKRAGLLSPERIEKCVREQLKAKRVDELFEAMEQMGAADVPAMTPEEIAEEIKAMRAERRAGSHNDDASGASRP